MVFSSITFLYIFLPLLLIVYFAVPNKHRNKVLLFFSLLFYFLGDPKYIIVLILSCIVNYFLSKKIVKSTHKKGYLYVAILYNIIQLLVFKYTDFFIANINNVLGFNFSFLYIVMPIGISFFTFQALGYVIDVYNKKHKPASSFWEFLLYISLFPQLIAGPIVRYIDVKEQLLKRNVDFGKFSYGVKRFTIGLAKKVLIANVLGEFSKVCIEETILSSWLNAISFTLQIYFDFSGYSDMAIGLGKMLGFTFLENFNYPLIASTITDFWRRWHISLSSFFRDYVYIPLGGNRVSKLKWIRNIFIVWFLTGFWHGASWNFIVWGLYFAVILLVEKLFLKKYLDKIGCIKYVYTSLIVIISFLIFSSNNLNEVFNSLKNMFFISKVPVYSKATLYYLKNYLGVFIIAFIASTPLMKNVINKLRNKNYMKIIDYIEPLYYLALLTLCTAFLIDEAFNPFLYFRF